MRRALPVPGAAARPHKPLRIAALDSKDDDAAVAQATEIFRNYADASGLLMETGFCSFISDLSAMPKAKKLTRIEAVKVLFTLSPEKKLTNDAFTNWWKNAHATFLPI